MLNASHEWPRVFHLTAALAKRSSASVRNNPAASRRLRERRPWVVAGHAAPAPPAGRQSAREWLRFRISTAETAISIHVYGTDVSRVGSSARRYYD